MKTTKKFYQQSWTNRLMTLVNQSIITPAQATILKQQANNQLLGDQQIENYLTDYHLPQGVACHYLIDGQQYLAPMVTEEPSVIAASSHGAGLVAQAGGFKTKIGLHILWGQIILEQVTNPQQLKQQLLMRKAQLLALADQAHPSLKKRGGGARLLRVRSLGDQLLSIDLGIDTQAAMGANMVNSMLEAVAKYLRQQLGRQVLMSILSNLADECLATATCRLPIELLTKGSFSGSQTAKKIALAAHVAQIDSYRAATHNKGIMNGVDAVTIAMGNDWRAIESAAHAYAARDGQYRGLSRWNLSTDQQFLQGELTLPLPVGFVGGSIKIVPLAQLNQQLAQIRSVGDLEKLLVCVGLAQNLAALLALVTEGIQRGHMQLQLHSTALAAGAEITEIAEVVQQLQAQGKTDLTSAQLILQKIRKTGDHQ
ncbi:hydroxymethylglutaryl-CoA reductase, degradative [Liquorilactobacillus sicerae]|uniref:hydroxymethylglutaryl-CoA reductase, degradative n=1 Tax=Liquorilactobacillus sicerae TaxID=1416943 RepID=UPI00247FB878|nr:hydroxymethylglutaryl-CoA reductase, degradative [Liquorilactobacillus sicerae]